MEGSGDGFFKKILDNLYDGVYFCDWDRKITYWNKSAEKITGFKKEEVVNSHCWDNLLVHTNAKGESLCETDRCPAVRAMRQDKTVEEEVYLRHKNGHRVPIHTRISPIKDENGKIKGAVEIFGDNSAKVAAFNKIEKLEELAFIDALTGVGNRRYSEIKIGAKLEEISRYAWAEEFGIIFVDIDRFKDFNDKFGHDAGDSVLRLVSKTILVNLREGDFIGRWGGEEFIVLVSGVDRKSLLSTAEKLRTLVENSDFKLEGASVNVTISSGATMAKKIDEMDKLMKRADNLMYQSKPVSYTHLTLPTN